MSRTQNTHADHAVRDDYVRSRHRICETIAIGTVTAKGAAEQMARAAQAGRGAERLRQVEADLGKYRDSATSARDAARDAVTAPPTPGTAFELEAASTWARHLRHMDALTEIGARQHGISAVKIAESDELAVLLQEVGPYLASRGADTDETDSVIEQTLRARSDLPYGAAAAYAEQVAEAAARTMRAIDAAAE